MRIGCLQFGPKVGDVSNNIARAEAVLSNANQNDLENLDLLVLPEMAFSGYNFRSQEHIAPYLELAGVGPSSQWARKAARKYNCTVAVGYPERAETGDPEPAYYNSLIVFADNGEKLVNYSKSFLYYTDATWAREGPGFYGGKLGNLGQTAMGICMDINPYKFEAPWDAYEFAFHILRVRANLVILSTAWLTNDERTAFLASPNAPDLHTLTYWVQRLEPVIRTRNSEETVVVFANRSGVEDEATYAGTSTVIGIRDGEVSVYGILGRGTEELLVVDTDKPPFGKLVSRPAVPVDDEPAPPPPPGKGTEEEEEEDDDDGRPPPRNAAPPEKSAPSYTDSPTLPPGFAPSARNHADTNRYYRSTTQAANNDRISNLRTAGGRPCLEQPVKPTNNLPRSRPKLTLRTNNLPPLFRSPFLASPPPELGEPNSPSPQPLSAVPIVVDDAYLTPDNDIAFPWPWGSGGGLPSQRWEPPTAASSPCTGAVIRVAVSPSVLAAAMERGMIRA
ncbi:putative N-terminal asparagine protein [Corynascus novoguineensis]|uniref:N-terminal asparagine protein n=1 Tax=Corynascus novoguineensis TaxID=1126955 RepID=A0AAN7CQR3_9PEZI|nr:putative N-terminal asparagine protein [Corynascus novoguineensis]